MLAFQVGGDPPSMARHVTRLKAITYPIPCRTTQVKGGAAWSALQDIKAVHVSVAASAETMPYTSLRKDAIAHKEVSVVVCIKYVCT